jgi:archaellin
MTFRRWLVIASACVLVAAIAVVVMLITLSDPIRQTADEVVRHAGIPGGATPGPHP